MGLNATVKAPAVISGSTTTGEQAKVTRMVVPGIKGADGDITWEGEWSSSTTYTQNEAVQYNGSAYVCLQGNSNLIPPNNTSAWSLMTSKGDTGPAGAVGSAGTITIGTVTTGSSGSSAAVTNSGTSSEAVLNFNLPKGSQGQQGTTGAAGAKGDTGATGAGATVGIGSVSTLAEGSSATVTNIGSATNAVFNFGIPMGQTGAQGTFRWKGAYNNSYTYGVNDVSYYNGSSYVCIQGTIGNVPTNTTYWDKLASAGAEGGAIASMEDTNISINPTDAAIIMFNDSNDKWEDNNVFGNNRNALQLDGGTF